MYKVKDLNLVVHIEVWRKVQVSIKKLREINFIFNMMTVDKIRLSKAWLFQI